MKRPKTQFTSRRLLSGKKFSSRPAVIPRRPDFDDNLSDAQRAQDLADFSDLLNEGHSETRLRSWMTVSAARKAFFSGLTFGTIRWPKSIGRPSSSTLAEGFVVQHHSYFSFWYRDLNGQIVEVEGWLPGLTVTVWDGTDDADHYRVNYLFNAAQHKPNRVAVKFSNIGWQRPGKSMLYGYRWMHPDGFEFHSNDGSTVLPPIQISLRMLIRV